MMVVEVPPPYLPGYRPTGYRPFDVTTFRDLNIATKIARDSCVTPFFAAGWEPSGKVPVISSSKFSEP